MKMPWNRDELGRELRAARPQPPAELEHALEQEIRAERNRSRAGSPRLRFGLAAATTAIVVVSFTAVGGMAAASSSVAHAISHVAQAVHLSSPAQHATKPATSPAGDQYGRKKTCLKTAFDRRAAALRAANAKLRRELAVASRAYKQRSANARKLAAAQKHAAMHAAYGKYLSSRKAAFKRHAAAVNKAKARYKADSKKCPTV
jgi:hypothetical protein